MNKGNFNKLILSSAFFSVSISIGIKLLKNKHKMRSQKTLFTKTQLLAVDYSNENIEEYISWLKDKKLSREELSYLIEAYHLLINFDIDKKYINDIKLLMEMNGYQNPFKYSI